MACKQCGAIPQQDFPTEITVTFPGIERLNHSPSIYACQHILVCLDCGFTELLIAPPELERLRKGMAASHSQGAPGVISPSDL